MTHFSHVASRMPPFTTLATPLLLLLAVLLNTLPSLFSDLYGDGYIHAAYQECFASNLRQGHWIPRWCPAIDDKLGSPIFLFYFPLPYYFAYPFTYLVQTAYPDISALKVATLLATSLTALTAYIWLRPLASKPVVIAGVYFFLFQPYRLELLYFRFAYAEVWFVAWLPLALYYLRQLLAGKAHAWPKFSLVLAICLLTHIPATAILLLGLAVYLLCRRASWKFFGAAGAAIILSATIAAYFLIPAIYYRQFMRRLEGFPPGYPNGFPDYTQFLSQTVAYLGTGLSVFLLLGLLIVYRRKRAAIPQALQTEAMDWLAVFAVAFLLYVPLSRWLYDLVPIIKMVLFPWRMQLLWMIVLTALFCTVGEVLASENPKRARGDFLALTLLLILLSLVMIGNLKAPFKLTELRLLPLAELMTRWQTVSDERTFLRYYTEHASDPDIRPLSAGTRLDRFKRLQDRIEIEAFCEVEQCRLRLWLRYFPTWLITGRSGASLAPEPESGMTIVSIPQGFSQLELRHAVANGAPWFVRAAPWISLSGIVVWVGIWCGMQRNRKRAA